MNMTVSVCVIAYNEEEYLPLLLTDIDGQSYPHELIQIVLVDSMSQDRTAHIMQEFKRKANNFRSIIIESNSKRIQAAGWNTAIAAAEGDVIIRVDAHGRIPQDFVSQNIKCLESGEFISGGVRKNLSDNNNMLQKILLEAENSIFCGGVNPCRRNAQKTYVKTMFHAAYRKEVFQKAGGFNECLLRTEDNELHYRMRNAGYKLCFDPSIISYQYTRNTLQRMIKQKYANGYWIGKTLWICPGCISLFHVVPALFVLAVILSSIMLICGIQWLFIALWTTYLLTALLMSIKSMIDGGFAFSKLLLPIIFLLIHFSYGIGTIIGFILMLNKRTGR